MVKYIHPQNRDAFWLHNIRSPKAEGKGNSGYLLEMGELMGRNFTKQKEENIPHYLKKLSSHTQVGGGESANIFKKVGNILSMINMEVLIV